MTRQALLLAASMLVAAPAIAGAPWISVELPANRINPEMRGAFLTVRTYYHSTPAQLIMRGTAEGLVNGERRSVQLAFRNTEQTGVYALDRNWGDEGAWLLDIRAFNGTFEMSAAVGIGLSGEVNLVRVPLASSGAPRTVTASEVSMMLGALANNQTPPRLLSAGFGLPWTQFAAPLAIFGIAIGGTIFLLAKAASRARAALAHRRGDVSLA